MQSYQRGEKSQKWERKNSFVDNFLISESFTALVLGVSNYCCLQAQRAQVKHILSPANTDSNRDLERAALPTDTESQGQVNIRNSKTTMMRTVKIMMNMLSDSVFFFLSWAKC